MDDNDPSVTITLKRSEWDCLVQCMGELLNQNQFSYSKKAFGHYVMDVWRKVKRLLP